MSMLVSIESQVAKATVIATSLKWLKSSRTGGTKVA